MGRDCVELVKMKLGTRQSKNIEDRQDWATNPAEAWLYHPGPVKPIPPEKAIKLKGHKEPNFNWLNNSLGIKK